MKLPTVVLWRIPEEILQNQSNYLGTNIYRSIGLSESEFDRINTNGPIPLPITSFEDVDVSVDHKHKYYYIVRFVRSDSSETQYYLAYKDLSPREKRIGESLRAMLSPFISCTLSDADICAGLEFGVKLFNELNPQTYWGLSDLPSALEPIVLWISGMFTLVTRYVPIAVTDISYSDNGLTLTVDRGSKLKTAIDTINAYIDKYILQIKWNYMTMGSGFGTIPLPLSIGGKMSSAVLNILDIFNVTGR